MMTLHKGIGLRNEFRDEFILYQPDLDFIEINAENYYRLTDVDHYYLNQLYKKYPIYVHSTHLSIAGYTDIDYNFLAKIKQLLEQYECPLFSDHLCWTKTDSFNTFDLLPIPFSADLVPNITSRINQIQDYLCRTISIENISYYVTFKHSDMSEVDFLDTICSRTGCGLLLDVSNLVINSLNHHYDPIQFLNTIKPKHVTQYHIAGFDYIDDVYIDTHATQVAEQSIFLLKKACEFIGNRPLLLEWDREMPCIHSLIKEINKISENCNDLF